MSRVLCSWDVEYAGNDTEHPFTKQVLFTKAMV